MILDKKMQIFMSVADAGSFSQAGRQLSLSQSVVSFHIDALEKDLGVSLFNRMGRTISLTPEGTMLYSEGKKICRSARELESALCSLTDNIDNRINLGGDALTCVFTLPWTLAAYREEHPDVLFTYRHFDHEALQEHLVNGDIDLALSGHPIRNRKLMTYQCFNDEIIYVSGPKDTTKSVAIDELCARPLIWATSDRGLELLLTKTLSDTCVTLKNLNIFMEVEDIAILKNFIRTGVGSAFLPRVSVQDELRFNLLREIPIEGLTIRRNTFLIHRKGKNLRETVSKFMDFVQRQDWTEGTQE